MLKYYLSMKKVLLIGIGGVYNYGCEAIIRGTVDILKTIDSTIEVYYASYNYEDDVKRLEGCDVKVIRARKFRCWSIRNILKKLCTYIDYIPFMDWIKEYDTVFSIGGDMYTLNSRGGFDKSLPLLCEKCKKLGLHYILWGASVGKFEKNPKALRFFQKHLTGVDSIVVREKHTFDYLHNIGITKNVVLAPDPAFFVAPELHIHTKSDHNVIGLNLSPLSALYQYGNLKDAMERQVEAIVRLIEVRKCTILLLPHVISTDYNDNDLAYMRDIYSRLPESYCSFVELIDSDPGFIGLKRFIMQCDFVIAARMHCAVNAISVGVPALFLAYSEKAKGMAEYVYNSNEPVISLKDFEDTPKISSLLDNWHYPLEISSLRTYDFKNILK